MRVLHVITALGVGGAERMLLKLLGAQALSGVEQRVVAMLPGGAMAGPMRATGAAVEELDFLGGVPVLSGARALASLARRFAPDIVQGWMYHGNLGASLARAALRRRVPLVWGIRQSLPTLVGENAWARLGIHLNRLASGRPERLLFNSQTSLEQHRAFGFDTARAKYLPNGFETSIYARDPQARARWRGDWRVDEDSVVFGLLARYHPVKGHALFLQAARRVLDARPRARFVMVGTGIDAGNAELSRVLADSGLGASVLLLGERKDIPALLSAMDVSVSSSRAEAFSNAVGEAMSCSLPCVVTAVGDSQQLVDETGLVVPPGDPIALAGAMIRMIDLGPAGRAALGARARQRIESEFGLEAVARRYAALYGELAGGPRRAD